MKENTVACQNSPRKKALHAALSEIDPSIPSGDRFWHNRGRKGDGSIKISNEAAEAALDAAFVAAVSGGEDDPTTEEWASVDADERLDMHIAWMRARNEMLEEGLTSGELSALSRYVTQKALSSEKAKQGEIDHAVKEKTRGLRTRTKAAIAGLGLLTLVSLAGSSLGFSQAAPETTTQPTPTPSALLDTSHYGSVPPVTASPNAVDGAMSKFVVNGKTVYTKVNKGKCAPGTVKVKATKTAKVKWQWKNGNISTKTVKKGKNVCKFTNTAGETSTAPTDSSGAITKLPSTFPSKPTAADIAKLGLTKDSKVSPSLRIPQPTGTANAPAQLAQKVRPAQVLNVYQETISNPGSAPFTSTRAQVEWVFTGGDGVLHYTSTDGPGQPSTDRYVKLNPNGTTTVTQVINIYVDPDDMAGKPVTNWFHGEIVPDYGQANLPASTVKDWSLPAAKDGTGLGNPVGMGANSAAYDAASGAPRDGFIMTDAAGNLVSRYDY